MAPASAGTVVGFAVLEPPNSYPRETQIGNSPWAQSGTPPGGRQFSFRRRRRCAGRLPRSWPRRCREGKLEQPVTERVGEDLEDVLELAPQPPLRDRLPEPAPVRPETVRVGHRNRRLGSGSPRWARSSGTDGHCQASASSGRWAVKIASRPSMRRPVGCTLAVCLTGDLPCAGGWFAAGGRSPVQRGRADGEPLVMDLGGSVGARPGFDSWRPFHRLHTAVAAATAVG